MNRERLMQILIAPHISEKSAATNDKTPQHVFRVLRDANKAEVKQAVELMFNVKVDTVRVLNTKGKTKTFQQETGRRKDWKKAYVRLVSGHEINFEAMQA
jgi:large subunit ribosomal protein L23